MRALAAAPARRTRLASLRIADRGGAMQAPNGAPSKGLAGGAAVAGAHWAEHQNWAEQLGRTAPAAVGWSGYGLAPGPRPDTSRIHGPWASLSLSAHLH